MSIDINAKSTNDTNYMQLPYESYRTCLTNHKGSIYIIPLIMY